MSAPTTLPDFDYNFTEVGTHSAPILAEVSLSGSHSIVLASAWPGDTSKAVIVGARTPAGKYMQLYIAAGGWADTTHATITTRCMTQNTSDIADEDTANDFDLPAGTIIFPVVSSFYLRYLNQAAQGDISSGIKFGERPTYSGTNAVFTDRVFADATARDAAITAPQFGDRCAVTSLGTYQKYAGGIWNDDATGTTANASSTVAGKVEIATTAESIAGTDTGGTGALLSVLPSDTAKNIQNQAHVYAADSVGTDAYAITVTPAVAAYAAGQRFSFKVGTANTGGATLAVSGLAATPILKFHDQALETGDIESGQIVDVGYDGTNFQMTSTVASQMSTANSTTLTAGIASDASSLHTHDIGSYISSATWNTSSQNLTIPSGAKKAVLNWHITTNADGGKDSRGQITVYASGVTSATDMDWYSSVGYVFNFSATWGAYLAVTSSITGLTAADGTAYFYK